jgi:hypothetical protein
MQETKVNTQFDFIGKSYLPAESMQDNNLVLKSIEDIMAWLFEDEGKADISKYDLIQWLRDNQYKSIKLQGSDMWMLSDTSASLVF